MPKVLLVGVHVGRLRVSRHLDLADTLKGELASFGYTLTAAGHMVTGAEGGAHDLVTAAALAVWYATHNEANGAAAWIAFMRGQAEAVPQQPVSPVLWRQRLWPPGVH